jgi:hypothetical protein
VRSVAVAIDAIVAKDREEKSGATFKILVCIADTGVQGVRVNTRTSGVLCQYKDTREDKNEDDEIRSDRIQIKKRHDMTRQDRDNTR